MREERYIKKFPKKCAKLGIEVFLIREEVSSDGEEWDTVRKICSNYDQCLVDGIDCVWALGPTQSENDFME